MKRVLWHILIAISIINLSFYGLSHSEEPIAGYVIIVKVRMEGSTRGQSIENIKIQPGISREKPFKPFDIDSITPSGLSRVVLLDAQGRVLYMMEFQYPTLMTVPPLPSGEQDAAPSVIPIENPEVTLVLPYFPNALALLVIPPQETRPSDSMPLSDAEFIKKIQSDAIPIEPAPFQPGWLNILIMASGYNTSNMTNFQTRASSLMQTLQNTEPFKSYLSKISINTYGNTTDLGCYTGCYNIDRLMCCDQSKVISAAASSGYYYDEIIVIHNTATYAGGGYRDYNLYKTNSYSSYCMMYDGYSTTVMGLHEFGHSFGNLCDEYTYGSEGYQYYDCVNCRANCTDWSPYSSSCQSGCDARSTYYRPENSVMLSLAYMTYNNPSIKAPYSPDGLEKRIQYFTGAITDGADKIGLFRGAGWYLDASGNGVWDGCSTDRCYTFGLATDTPVAGDWNGGGTKKIGLKRGNAWYLDYNGNGIWDGCSVDRCYTFGLATDIPVIGDWNNSGSDKIGVFRSGNWYLDYNGNGAWNGCGTDLCIAFGLSTDIPVAGDWNGDGYTEIGVVRNGVWYLDYDGSDSWSGCATDRCYTFGLSTDTPVVGDWSGSGTSKIGVKRGNGWYLDYNGNGSWSGCSTDRCFTFGLVTDKPVTGNW